MTDKHFLRHVTIMATAMLWLKNNSWDIWPIISYKLEIGHTVKKSTFKKWIRYRRNTLSCVTSTHNIESKVFLKKGWPLFNWKYMLFQSCQILLKYYMGQTFRKILCFSILAGNLKIQNGRHFWTFLEKLSYIYPTNTTIHHMMDWLWC